MPISRANAGCVLCAPPSLFLSLFPCLFPCLPLSPSLHFSQPPPPFSLCEKKNYGGDFSVGKQQAAKECLDFQFSFLPARARLHFTSSSLSFSRTQNKHAFLSSGSLACLLAISLLSCSPLFSCNQEFFIARVCLQPGSLCCNSSEQPGHCEIKTPTKTRSETDHDKPPKQRRFGAGPAALFASPFHHHHRRRLVRVT